MPYQIGTNGKVEKTFDTLEEMLAHVQTLVDKGEIAVPQYKSKSCKEWRELMTDKPCYAPCPPFYDMCNNMGRLNIKRLNCDECFEIRGLVDYLE